VSKNKIFTLIHGDDVHLAPGVKVLSADSFSDLLSAEELVKKTKEDAEQYVREVTREGEELKEQAQREGFEEGFKEWMEKVAELEDRIAKVHDEVHGLVIPVALQAAKKIVGREIELKPETIRDIVADKLKAVAQHKKIKIFVHRDDLKILEKHKEKLRSMFELLESLSLVEKNDITPGGCVIETEGGIINAQIENQWEIIETAFQAYMDQNVKQEENQSNDE
jgi:type III secretion protein L